MSAPTLSRPNRDSVTTIRSDGSRPFLYPADAPGRFLRARRLTSAGLIVFYLSLPWIKVGGYPAVFLDVAERRFHLFGITLAAQDLWLMFFLITGVGFSLFFITALFGRIWCGWACPQTVFLDHVYRRIERWIDGDAIERRRLAAAPRSPEKIARRAAKHAAYLAVSAVITHLFLAYFVSLPQVWHMMSAAPTEHWSAFAFIAIATGILYFNFGWFREQLCIVICPYGRIQSALTDDNTMVIGYDAKRGEPRGKPAVAGAGACIDCNRCVNVCPTGIDIRQGLQMECIGCAACIDACDEVMDRIHRPRGLIRYDSLNGLAGGATRWLRSRTLLYFVLLLVGAGAATWALSTVRPANFLVLRMTGAPYFVDPAMVRNQFFVRIVNKRTAPAQFVVEVNQLPAGITQTGSTGTLELGPLAEVVEPLVLQQPRAGYTGPFEFEVRVADARGTFHLERNVKFLGPEARLLREDEAEQAAHARAPQK